MALITGAALLVLAVSVYAERKHWTLEMGSPTALTRAGWSQNTLKMGDQVDSSGVRNTETERAQRLFSVLSLSLCFLKPLQ
jgi:hypothetical protein